MAQAVTQTPSRATHILELQRRAEEYQRALDRQAELHHHQSDRPSQRRRHNPTTTMSNTIDYDEIRRHFERRERENAYLRARQEAHDALVQQEQLMAQHARALSQAQARADSFRLASSNRTSNHHPSNQQQQQQNSTPSQHRVYLINCKNCGTFLTDRGMKAVLLLRPHITLYSTDAMPNCGALHSPSRLAEPSAPHEPIVERTCDCLTQSLGCYGCGNAVGYHIVSPCQRCTNSVAKHQRSSNGHRTVLHCAEIFVRERRYVPGEPGVMVAPFTPTPPVNPQVFAYNQAYRNSRNNNVPNRPNEEDEENDDEEDEEEDDEEDQFEDEEEKALRNDPFVHAHQSKYRALKRGDVLFWSDLAAGGERSPPIDSDEHLDLPVAGR